MKPDLSFLWKESYPSEKLKEMGLPELEVLKQVPQDPRHHPEGSVYEHTLMVVDIASEIVKGFPITDESFRKKAILAALLHDFGKADAYQITIEFIRHRRHETKTERAMDFLNKYFPDMHQKEKEQIIFLIRKHMFPMDAGEKGKRRLVRKLLEMGNDMVETFIVMYTADKLGRLKPHDFDKVMEFAKELLTIKHNLTSYMTKT